MVIDIDEQYRHARRKLLTGSEVEVLSMEENLQGSWHKAIIIDHAGLTRTVKYTNRFLNNSNFVESIPVSYAIDGYLLNYPSQNDPLQDHSSQISVRNKIRPVPYRKPIEQADANFGTCVDLFAKDAFFEGVLLDQNMVLLPDLGNLENVSLNSLSLSLDWNEVTGEWKPRGKWMFLEALKENQECAELAVSVRELWYEVKSNPNFISKIGVWHLGTRNEWDSLLSIIMKEFKKVKSDEFLDVVSEFVYSYQTKTGTGTRLRAKQESAQSFLTSIGWLFKETKSGNKFIISPDGTRYRSFIGACEAYLSTQLNLNPPCEKTRTRTRISVPVRAEKRSDNELNDESATQMVAWESVELDPEYSAEVERNGFDGSIDKDEIRKHLLYLGWVIEIKRDKMVRYRYRSPDGKSYYSINQMKNQSICGINNGLICGGSVSKREKQTQELPKFDMSSQNGEDFELGEDYLIEDIEPENLPDSIQEYIDNAVKRLNTGKKGYICPSDLRLSVKKHLLFLGWTRCYRTGATKPRLFYESPTGKLFGSLLTACKACLRDGIQETGTGSSVPVQVKRENKSKERFEINACSASEVNENEDVLFEQLKWNLDGFVSHENSPVTPLETEGFENGGLKKKRRKSGRGGDVTKYLENLEKERRRNMS